MKMKKKYFVLFLLTFFLIILALNVFSADHYLNFDGNVNDLDGNMTPTNVGGNFSSISAIYNVSGNGNYSIVLGFKDRVELNDEALNRNVGSIAFWMNHTDHAGNGVILYTAITGRMIWRVDQAADGTNVTRFQIFDGAGKFVNELVAHNVGEWVHYVGTWNSSTVELWKNGTSQGTQVAGAINGALGTFVLGLDDVAVGNFYKGGMDEFKLWDRQLNITEIKNLYNYGNISGVAPAPSDTLNLSNPFPRDNTQFGTQVMNFNLTANCSDPAGFDCQLIINPTLFVSEEWVTNTQASFDTGVYNRTFFNTSFVQLNASIDNGSYSSKILDTSMDSTWNNISWWRGYGFELPNYKVEEDYVVNFANMTGNILLMHFNNDSSVGENDSLVYDFSGMGNNGTVVGGALFNESGGKFNGAFQFDGNDDWISVADTDDLDLQGEFTIMGWFKTTVDDQNIVLFAKGYTLFGNYLLMKHQSNAIRFFASADGLSWGTDIIGPTINNDIWYHVAITHNGSTTQLYLNGTYKAQDTTPATPAISLDPLNIGRRGFFLLNYFNGTIDEIAIFNRTLSATEILDIYKRGTLKLNLTTRSCNDSVCSGETWTDYSDVSPQNLSEIDNKYFQYKFDFETDTVSYSPELYNVSVNYYNYSISELMNSYPNGTNIFVNFTVNFSIQTNYTFRMICNDTNTTENTSVHHFWLDWTYPRIDTDFVNDSVFYQNLTGQFNFTDNLFLHRANLSIDGTQIFGILEINDTFYQINLSYNLENISIGLHTLTAEVADGHSDDVIGNYILDVKNDYVKFSFVPPEYKSGWIKISQKNSNVLDTWIVEKEFDRYNFSFKSAIPSTDYTFVIEAESTIHIIEAPWTKYKKWLIYQDHWIDLFPYEITEIKRLKNNLVEVIIHDSSESKVLKFSSIGDLNVLTKNYTFFHVNITESNASLYLNTSTYSINYNNTITIMKIRNVTYSVTNDSGVCKGIVNYGLKTTQNMEYYSFCNGSDDQQCVSETNDFKRIYSNASDYTTTTDYTGLTEVIISENTGLSPLPESKFYQQTKLKWTNNTGDNPDTHYPFIQTQAVCYNGTNQTQAGSAEIDFDWFGYGVWSNVTLNLTGGRKVKFPEINFVPPTTNSSINWPKNWIAANVSVIASDDFAFESISIYLYDNGGILINSTSNTSTTLFFNFTNLLFGTYYLNASANDTEGHANWTETRNITSTFLVMNLCPSINRILFLPNLSYYNITTGMLTQYNISPINNSDCGWTYNFTAPITGILQARINITLNSSYILRYNNTIVNSTTWANITNATITNIYHFNITGDYINATSTSPNWEDSFQII